MPRLPATALCACMIVGAAALIAGGCALGPDYARPAVEHADSFRMQRGAERDAASLADLGWWELFQDAHLHALIRQALLNNTDVRMAVARVREARAQLGATGADQFPRLDGGAGLQRNQTSLARARGFNVPGAGDQEGPTFNLFDAALGLSFELDVWGKLRRATEAAQAELLAREWARRTVSLTLVSNVAQAYFDLQALDREREIAERALATRLESLEILRLRKLMGQSSTLDLRRAEQDVARARTVLPDLTRRIGQTEHLLSILAGRRPDAVSRNVPPHTWPAAAPRTWSPTAPDVPAGLPSALLERRPDILEAEQRLVAANARIGVAKAALFPAISLTGSFGAQSLEFSDLFVGPTRAWSLGPAVTVPLFHAGRHRANVRVSRARQAQARIAYERAIQQAFREVEDALIAHHTIRDTRATRERLVAISREALQLAHLEYLNGQTSYLDVLVARRELFDAEVTLAHTHRDQRVAVVHLYKALGGGWRSPSQSQSTTPVAAATPTTATHDVALRESPR